MDDLILVERVKNNQCSDSLVELSKRHEGLFKKITSRYIGCLNLSESDINTEKLFVLWRCCETFDLTKKSKFTTWYANQVRFCWLNRIKKETRNILNVSSNIEEIDPDKVIEQIDNEDDILSAIESEVNNLPENDRQLVKLRYNTSNNKNCSWNEIRKSVGVSNAKLTKQHKLALKKIKNKIKEYGI